MATLESSLAGYITFMAVYVLLFIGGVGVFILRRNQQPIEPRNIALSILSASVGLFQCVVLCVDLMLEPLGVYAPVTCGFVVAGSTILLPLWGLPFYLRSFLLIYRYHWQVEKLNISILLARKGLRHVPESSIQSGLSHAESDISLREIAGSEDSGAAWQASPSNEKGPRPSFSAPEPGWYSKHRWLTSNKFIYSVIAGVTLIHVIATLIAQFTQNNNFGEDFGSCISNLLIPFAIFAVLYLLVLAFLVFKLWKVRDAFFIKTELRFTLIIGLPLFIAWLVCYLVPIPAGLSPAWFVIALVFLLFLVVIFYPIYLSTLPYWHLSPAEYELQPAFFARLSHARKSNNPLTTSMTSNSSPQEEGSETGETSSKKPAGSRLTIPDHRESDVSETNSTAPMAAASQPKVSAKDIPQDSLMSYLLKPQFLESFEKFCIQAWCVELVLFFVDSDKFSYMKGEDMKAEAKRIVKMYLTDDAELELENISDRVMEDIKSKIASDQISSTLLAEARMEVYDQMCKFVFPVWQKSTDFKKLIANEEKEGAAATTTSS